MGVAISEPDHRLEESARKFIINISSENLSDFEVRSCEIASREFRNRTSFQNRITIDQIFQKEIAEGLKSCLMKLSGETEVIALPSVVLEIPGLTLAGAYLVSTKTQEGDLHIIVRFRFFVGGINNMFLPNIGFDDAANDHAAGLSVKVLSDLALPFLNVCESYRSGVISTQAGFTEFMAGLSACAQDFRFQVELLKRFVDAKEKSNPNLLKKPASTEL